MPSFLECRDVEYTYHSLNGETKALKHISFTVDEGEFVAIVGPSGCGKTTILSLLCGQLAESAGEILFRGKPLRDHVDFHIGYMPQQDQLFEWRNVYGNVTLGLEIQKKLTEENQSYARKLMEEYGLWEFRHVRPSQLSGGMRQRAALIRTLVLRPSLLLLDEPFSALDSYLKWELEQEMRDMLAEVQKPVLFVSHNRDEVYRLCSMVSCIDHGKMEVIEETKEFFHNPKTKTAAVLSGCKNISAVEIVDDHHIKALDWGITLCVPEIPEDTKAVGIRAHSFYPEDTKAVSIRAHSFYPEDTKAVGIRAHSFYPVDAEQIPGRESAADESCVSVIQEGTGLKKYRNPVHEENIFKKIWNKVLSFFNK